MIEPTFDADGYPTDETLDAIRTWPIDKMTDCERLIDFVGRAWSYPNYWHRQPRRFRERRGSSLQRRYLVSTGGWSGNEDLIGALEANVMWSMLCEWSWRRGGHYEYRVPTEDLP